MSIQEKKKKKKKTKHKDLGAKQREAFGPTFLTESRNLCIGFLRRRRKNKPLSIKPLDEKFVGIFGDRNIYLSIYLNKRRY